MGYRLTEDPSTMPREMLDHLKYRDLYPDPLKHLNQKFTPLPNGHYHFVVDPGPHLLFSVIFLLLMFTLVFALLWSIYNVDENPAEIPEESNNVRGEVKSRDTANGRRAARARLLLARRRRRARDVESFEDTLEAALDEKYNETRVTDEPVQCTKENVFVERIVVNERAERSPSSESIAIVDPIPSDATTCITESVTVSEAEDTYSEVDDATVSEKPLDFIDPHSVPESEEPVVSSPMESKGFAESALEDMSESDRETVCGDGSMSDVSSKLDISYGTLTVIGMNADEAGKVSSFTDPALPRRLKRASSPVPVLIEEQLANDSPQLDPIPTMDKFLGRGEGPDPTLPQNRPSAAPGADHVINEDLLAAIELCPCDVSEPAELGLITKTEEPLPSLSRAAKARPIPDTVCLPEYGVEAIQDQFLQRGERPDPTLPQNRPSTAPCTDQVIDEDPLVVTELKFCESSESTKLDVATKAEKPQATSPCAGEAMPIPDTISLPEDTIVSSSSDASDLSSEKESFPNFDADAAQAILDTARIDPLPLIEQINPPMMSPPRRFVELHVNTDLANKEVLAATKPEMSSSQSNERPEDTRRGSSPNMDETDKEGEGVLQTPSVNTNRRPALSTMPSTSVIPSGPGALGGSWLLKNRHECKRMEEAEKREGDSITPRIPGTPFSVSGSPMLSQLAQSGSPGFSTSLSAGYAPGSSLGLTPTFPPDSHRGFIQTPRGVPQSPFRDFVSPTPKSVPMPLSPFGNRAFLPPALYRMRKPSLLGPRRGTLDSIPRRIANTVPEVPDDVATASSDTAQNPKSAAPKRERSASSMSGGLFYGPRGPIKPPWQWE